MSVEMLVAIAAIITAVGGVLGTILASNKKLAVIETEMKEIKNRLDTHNKYAEKFGEIQKSQTKMETAIEVIKTKMEYIAKEADK